MGEQDVIENDGKKTISPIKNTNGTTSKDDSMDGREEKLDEMSFYSRDSFLSPKAPPPAAAPPPPPPPSNEPLLSPDTKVMGGSFVHNNEYIIDEEYAKKLEKKSSKKKKKKASINTSTTRINNSYQQQYAIGSSAIENYGTVSASGPLILNLTPVNTGQSNAKHKDNVALNEIVRRVRVLNICLCSITIIEQMIDWIFNFVLLRWATLVIGVYLQFFSITMLLYELHNPTVAKILRDNIGIIYSSGGRSFCYLLMGSMCIGQMNGIMYITGCLMIFNSFYSVYVSCRYPDYESVYAKEGTSDNNIVAEKGKQFIWTETTKSVFSSPIGTKPSQMNNPEKEALLNP